MTKTATKPQKQTTNPRLVLPVAEPTDGYLPRHVDLQLSKEQAEMLVQVREGLRATNAKLTGGRPVFSNNDVVRWLFENLKEYVEYAPVSNV